MTEVEDVILLPCAVCGRTFRPEALAKHSVACERQHTKKRKKFDSAKQRIQGTELAEFLGPPPLVNKPKPPSPKKVQSRWKEKHEALVKTIRAEQVKPLDHSQCPHCDRCFGPKAFDRHEAWCREQHSKIHVQNQNQDVSKAKERLHARTKYRAPSFKSQRSLTKEKYSPARPPVGLSTSSTFPSPAVEHHEPRLHRNASSVSATEVGVSGSGYGVGGQKSPALKRQNSLSRSNNKKTEEESIRRPQDTAKKHDDPLNSSIPTLARTSRTGSLSSQGSDSKSVASPNHSYVASERGSMGSAATATPLHESKPTIKNSYSTNRKGKRDDSKSESKKWKRKPEASEQSSNKSGVVPDFSAYNSGQNGESSGKNQRKVWSRLKSRNSIPLLVGSKLKKSKGKLKKSKPISPVKSSSSHKTITLSDRENELDNLKELNRRCEDTSFHYKGNTSCLDMSACFDRTSDFDPTKKDLNNTSDNSDVIPENTDNNYINIEDFDQIPENSTFVIEKNVVPSKNIEDSNNPTPQLKNPNVINDELIQNYKNAVIVKPLSWVIPLSQSDDAETDLENVNIDELNTGEKLKSDENLSEVIKLPEERNVLNEDENEVILSDDAKISDDCITEKFAQDNDVDRAKNCLNLDSVKMKDESIIKKCESRPSSRKSNRKSESRPNSRKSNRKSESRPSSKKLNKLKIEKNGSSFIIKTENSCVSDIFIVEKLKEKSLRKKSFSLKSNDGGSSSENLPSLGFDSAGFSRLNKIEEIPDIQPERGELVKKSKLKNDKKKIRKQHKCECHKIIETIQCNLTLLSQCKCLTHSNRASRSCEGNSKSSNLKYSLRKRSNLSCSGVFENGNKMFSYSDSEIYKLNEAFHDGFGKNQSKFSVLHDLKNKCYKDSASQTCSRNMFYGQSDSENGSVCSHHNNRRDETKRFQNEFDLCPSKRDLERGGTPRRFCNGFGMGERLRDVRRLLNRSVEAQSNDSFDYIEEDRSTLNGSLSERNPQFEMEEINSCVQYPEGRNNEVILTSVKRLSNPREKLNRRIALREWQVVQSGCSNAPQGTWQQFDQVNQTWKMSGGGDGTCGLTQPSSIHLPPLGNSTPKRDLERYDPFVTAELQMLELLRSDEEATSPVRKPQQNINDKMTQSASDIAAPGSGEKMVDKMSSSVGSSRKSSFDNIMPSVTSKRALSAGCRPDNIIVNRATRAVTAPIITADRIKEMGASDKTQSDGIKLKETLRKRSLEPLSTEPTRGKGASSPSSPFRTSPTSAFFPVLNDQKETNPTNNNNNNNLNNNTSINNNKNNNNNNENEFKMLSLSTLSLCSEGSLETLEPNLRVRSSSTVPRQTKQRLNMHDLLFGLESTNEESNEGLNDNKSRKREVERCEAQLLRSMVEFELLLNRDNDTPSPVPTPPPNLVTDSAYSSLNRRWSPSGGEQITGSGASAQDDSGALSKFCHECGGRYPVAGAKFCCLCGVRRLAI